MARTMHTDELADCDYRLHPGDCVWYNDGEFMIADELGRLSTMRVQKFVLDLSPLQKFMGRPRKSFWAPINPVKGMVWIATDCPGPGPAEQPHQWDGERWVRMYGMDYDFDWVPPAPSPEPERSPLDKALEDFVAKRKAKREGVGGFEVGQHDRDAAKRIDRYAKEVRDGQALDRAMRRLSFHEQDIHTRLMPYRREE